MARKTSHVFKREASKDGHFVERKDPPHPWPSRSTTQNADPHPPKDHVRDKKDGTSAPKENNK